MIPNGLANHSPEPREFPQMAAYKIQWLKGGIGGNVGLPWNDNPSNLGYIDGLDPAEFRPYLCPFTNMYITAVDHARDADGVSRGAFVSTYAGIADGIVKVRFRKPDGSADVGGTSLIIKLGTKTSKVAHVAPGALVFKVKGKKTTLTVGGKAKPAKVGRAPTLGTGKRYVPR